MPCKFQEKACGSLSGAPRRWRSSSRCPGRRRGNLIAGHLPRQGRRIEAIAAGCSAPAGRRNVGAKGLDRVHQQPERPSSQGIHRAIRGLPASAPAACKPRASRKDGPNPFPFSSARARRWRRSDQQFNTQCAQRQATNKTLQTRFLPNQSGEPAPGPSRRRRRQPASGWMGSGALHHGGGLGDQDGFA